MKIMRRCFGCTRLDRVNNLIITRSLGTQPLSVICKERRWGYFGNVYRMPPTRYAKTAITATLQGQKYSQGLKTQWRKQIRLKFTDLKEKTKKKTTVERNAEGQLIVY